MKFNLVDPPYNLEEYYTKYPEGLTIYEALLSWLETVNQLIDTNNTLDANVNAIRQELDTFYETVSPELLEYATQLVEEMKLNGDFDAILGALITVYTEDTLKRFNEIFVNVKDFGALGNGIADDTVAIQAAIDSFSTKPKGGTLYFPEGVYRVSNGFTVPTISDISVPIKFLGANNGFNQPTASNNTSASRSIIRCTVDGFTLFDLTTATESRVHFESLSLWGFIESGTEFPAIGSFAIKANKFTGGGIVNCVIRGFEIGVHIINEFYYSRFRDNYIRDCRIACMDVGLVNGSVIETSHFRDSRNAIGLRLQQSGRSVNIQGCWFEGCNIGISALGVRQLNCFGTYFEDNLDCHVRLQYLDEGRYGATGNFYGCSFRLNETTLNAIKSTVTVGGVIVNLYGCTYALSAYDQGSVTKTVVGTAGGSVTFAPYIFSVNTYAYQLASGMLPIPIAPATWPNKVWIEGGRHYVNNNSISYSNVIPTSGEYRIGDRVYRTNPTAGSNEGWVCITTGNPGVWKAFGSIAV